MRRNVSKPSLILILLIVASAATGALLGIERFYDYKTLGLDLGAFNQVIYNIATTGAPLTTLTPDFLPQNWFGFHFSPILYLVAAIYKLAPRPETLQVIQATCIALTAWPIYRALLAFGETPKRALLWAATYLFNPFTLNALVWDFHENSIAALLFGFALWAIAAHKWKKLVITCALLVLTKEHYGIAVAGLGALWMQKTTRKRGLALAAFGFIACALILLVVMPQLRGNEHVLLGDTKSAAAPHFQWLMREAEWLRVIPALVPQWIYYAGFLLVPFCLLPLAAPLWLLPAAADLAVVLLSETEFYRSVFSYHSAAIIPMLTIAAYHGSLRLSRTPLFKDGQARLAAEALLLALLCGWLLAPLPLPGAKNIWELGKPHAQSDADKKALEKILKLVPEEAGLSAQCNIGAFVSARPRVFIFPFVQDVDFILLNLKFPFANTLVAMGAPYCVDAKDYREQVKALLADRRVGIYYWQSPWLLLKRHAKEHAGPRLSVRAATDALEKEQLRLETQSAK